MEGPDKPPGMSPMKQEEVHIIPFKKSHVKRMPFKKGQGISLAGWQFEIKNVLPNGNILLITRGELVTGADNETT
ncbi:hypothetical protein LCGC14_1348100 [marine sediment metagenome]|uniref:Uncharacterized protein n=1 Tax=marine sediment metagenome TaxID=412755 RepID=A0A0F9NDY9_9ZZZZ